MNLWHFYIRLKNSFFSRRFLSCSLADAEASTPSRDTKLQAVSKNRRENLRIFQAKLKTPEVQ